MARNKITIVGAGNVGATTAHIAATRQLGDIVLIDIVDGLAQGKALDIAEAAPVQLYDCIIVGTCDWRYSYSRILPVAFSNGKLSQNNNKMVNLYGTK